MRLYCSYLDDNKLHYRGSLFRMFVFGEEYVWMKCLLKVYKTSVAANHRHGVIHLFDCHNIQYQSLPHELFLPLCYYLMFNNIARRFTITKPKSMFFVDTIIMENMNTNSSYFRT